MPDMNASDDSNHCIDPEKYVRVALNVQHFAKQQYSSKLTKSGMLPRLMWLDKSWSMKQVHVYVFDFIKEVIAEWIDWRDPGTEKKPKPNGEDLRKSDNLIDFPFRPSDWPESKPFTKKDFLAMNIEDSFRMTFPGLMAGGRTPNDDGFSLKDKPYLLQFKNVSGTWSACEYCGQ
jgi:hypothetical protein